MKSIVSFFVLLKIAFSLQSQVTVSVFYETKCKDSINFITGQLVPAWKYFGGPGNPVFVIDYIPYGKANEQLGADGVTKTIECHHGPEECQKNKEHACAMKYLPKREITPFINCSLLQNLENCTEAKYVEKISKCVGGAEGDELLAEYGNRTKQLTPPLTWVPWIILDGVFSQADLDDSQKNITEVLCRKTKTCVAKASQSSFEDPSHQVTVSVFYETKCKDSINFITGQLVPTWKHFGGPGNPVFVIDYVPYGKANKNLGADGVTKTIDCHHGPEECQKNKEHACALKYLPKREITPFINCSLLQNLENCTEAKYVEKISKCVGGAEGDELLAEYGNRTKQLTPPLTWVPWIILDGVFSQADLDDSQKNITAVLCRKTKACEQAKTVGTSKSSFLIPANSSLYISILTILIYLKMKQ